MQERRRKLMEERVVRDLSDAFPPVEPGRQKYIVDKDKFAFYIFDSRPKGRSSGLEQDLDSPEIEWTKTPVAKLSFIENEQLWQLSWMPPQGRWQRYGRYYDVETAVLIIKGDPVGCFLGDNSPLAYLGREKKSNAQGKGD